MKYSVFALSAIALVGSGCFNPNIKNGGFACTGAGVSQCPSGFFCVNGLCVNNPNQVVVPQQKSDMAMALGSSDMSMAMQATTDMAMQHQGPLDMAMMSGPPDMAKQQPPDMVVVSSCAHSPCKTGAALDPSCNSCVDQFCNDSPLFGGDPTCCSSTWDSICVSEYRSYGCTCN